MLAFVASVFFGAVLAQASSAATPAPTPSPLTYSGYLRGYYFTRQNASGYPQTFRQINQASFNQALDLHVQYNFVNSPISVGATYLYASPLNNCTSPQAHLTLPCGEHTFSGRPPVPTNPDDTLPGFELNTLYEAYVQYKDPSTMARLGDQVLTTPWANPSDSRLKPVAFQGGDLVYRFAPKWTGEVAYMDRFESRASSDFDDATLLTSHPADAAGTASNIYTPGGGPITTGGFVYGRVGYTESRVGANVHYYDFLDIANAFWLDAKYTFQNPLKPYLAIQVGTETNSGRSVIGKIASQVFGVQGGLSIARGVDLAASYDDVPRKSDTIVLPPGVKCSATKHQISVKGGVTFPYFLPSGGTTNCEPDGAQTTIYYGGWASPYTDSYATDPLFTTSISQGMADRRSPGSAVKIQMTYTIPNKRLRFIASRAWYLYGNGTSGVSHTQETDLDATYYFNNVGTGAYKGLLLRHRYAERTEAYTQFYGGSPLFKYNRTQLEYDF